jgi:hypothetical protein
MKVKKMIKQKKLRKLAIKKLMADGCPEDLARLMPKPSGLEFFQGIYGSYRLPHWFIWEQTRQGFRFWKLIYKRDYNGAYKALALIGQKPWQKKSKSVENNSQTEAKGELQRDLIGLMEYWASAFLSNANTHKKNKIARDEFCEGAAMFLTVANILRK